MLLLNNNQSLKRYQDVINSKLTIFTVTFSRANFWWALYFSQHWDISSFPFTRRFTKKFHAYDLHYFEVNFPMFWLDLMSKFLITKFTGVTCPDLFILISYLSLLESFLHHQLLNNSDFNFSETTDQSSLENCFYLSRKLTKKFFRTARNQCVNAILVIFVYSPKSGRRENKTWSLIFSM